MKKYIAAGALAALSVTSANAATFQFFTDRTSFNDVVGDRISFDLSSSSSLLSITGDDVVLSGGLLNDTVDQDDAPDTILGFGIPLFGFGADFDLSPLGAGSGISVTVSTGSESFLLAEEIPSTLAGGFWGFISDTLFDEISFSEGSNASRPQETYTLTGPTGALNIATVAPVPLPAGLPLMLAGLGSFVFVRKRCRQAAA